MNKFQYRAKDRSGKPTSGEIEASSLAAARQQLRRDGLFVMSLSAASEPTASAPAKSSAAWGHRIKKTDLLMMMSQLTIMCQSGVDLADAIKNVAQQMTKPAFRDILLAVHEDISSGVSFSESLRRHPQVFDDAFVAGMAAGEQAGAITPVLERLTHLTRTDIKLRSAVWSMLMYPLVLCGVTFVVLNAIVFFVLPQFAKVFADLGTPAPPITQLMLSAGQSVSDHKVFVLGLLAACVVGLAAVRRTATARRGWDYLTLHAAFIRDATRALAAGRIFRLLGTMLASGVPLVDGIRLCRGTAKNGLFRDLFEKIEHDVLHGEGLGKPLLEATFLPSGAAQMVATAERCGNLGNVLQTVGEYFEEEGEKRIRDLVKILEPAVIVLLGLIVAVVVLSVVLPLLDVSTSPG